MQEDLKSEMAVPPGDGQEVPDRWSVQRKAQVVVRLLRGEDLESLSREVKVSVAELAGWRDAFLAGGQQALKSRGGDPVEKQLKDALAKVGELTMKVELQEYLLKKTGQWPVRRTPEL